MRWVPENCLRGWHSRGATLAAGPRNHLYRTGRPLIEGRPFLFALLHAHLDHMGDFTDDLDFETAVCGSNNYALEEAAQDLDRFISNM